MTITVADNVVSLAGSCLLEDAEVLLQALIDHPSAVVDWSLCKNMHTAVLQVLMAANRELKGTPASPFLKNWLYGRLKYAENRPN